ncbi:hypothetical protein ACFP3I_11910 [Chryseobacterium arachidis]|uniref:hypothetical protein n=1 Tax=Chryseobacterium arachidis TaxID=1416778 RepID=UPI003613ACEC
MAALNISQTRNTFMSGVKHQVFKLMALIHKNVVNAHHLKINNIILPVFNIMF